MSEQGSGLGGLVEGLTKGALAGFKFGGGVLRAVVPISVVGLVALAAVIYGFRGPWYATAAIALLIVGYMVYTSERAYHYAKADPISALLGGSQFYQALRDQMAAKNPSIMIDASPTTAAGRTAPDLPEMDAPNG